jgi:hypothetical protein
MAELLAGSVVLRLLIGTPVPVPVPAGVIDALTAVKVENGSGDTQSGFELTFRVPRESPVQAFFAIAVPIFRCIIAVTVRGSTEVLMDGLITHVDVAPEGPTSTVSVKGKDLTQAMDLVPLDGLPYPAMTPSERVRAALLKYMMLGCAPGVVPAYIEERPMPNEAVPAHQGTDYAYLKQLAAAVGYVFYVEPGPAMGASIAYWGPEVRVGVPQPAITYGFGAEHDNCSALSFSYDREKRKTPIVTIQEKWSKSSFEVPIPNDLPFSPPLGAVPPLPPVTVRMRDTGKLPPEQALMRGIAFAVRNADAVTGTGTLDVARYGSVLRSRRLVGVRGSGIAFDGLYYVSKVVHELKRGSYHQQFTLVRGGFISTVPRVPA